MLVVAAAAALAVFSGSAMEGGGSWWRTPGWPVLAPDGAGGSADPPPAADPFDLKLSGATVVDGSGKEPFVADLGIRGDRIAAVGDLSDTPAARVIDASGLAVAPGFINLHSHTYEQIFNNPDATPAVMQGITTELGGVDGRSPVDLGQHLAQVEAQGTGVNYAMLVGQGSVRGAVMGHAREAAGKGQLAAMERLVADAMADGAWGLSTGLEYEPGKFARLAEITPLASRAGAAGGIYSTHLRSEGDRLLEALEEAVAVARAAGTPLNVSHFKVVYRRNWHQADAALAMLAEAQQAGLDLVADVYPYLAPDYASHLPLAGAADHYAAEHLVIKHAADRNLVGLTVAEAAARWGVGPEAAVGRLLAAGGDPTVVANIVSEDNLERFLQAPFTVIANDASARPWHRDPREALRVHPRAYGAFPRVLGRYTRERNTLSLAAAVNKMTGAPAEFLGLVDRGFLRPGYFADLVVFDPATVKDQATWHDPQQYPDGIRFVFVNGQAVVEDGVHREGVRPGRVLRGPGIRQPGPAGGDLPTNRAQ